MIYGGVDCPGTKDACASTWRRPCLAPCLAALLSRSLVPAIASVRQIRDRMGDGQGKTCIHGNGVQLHRTLRA